MATLIFNHVRKNYGKDNDYTVKDFHLEVKDKEFLVLVGPSGCGKSTTLRMIAGLEEITEGELIIGDQIVNEIAPKNRDIAMVFQNYALYPHMTIYKNMALALQVRKFPKEEIDRRVKEASEILGIAHLLDRKPKHLSGGQRQRVALGRAIVREPQVFLMDEPLSNLDAKLRVQMRTEIGRLHKRLGATFVYVTHDQTEAMTMGDRIVVMNNGVIQQVASPHEIYNHPANKYVAGFIGSPGMNFIDGEIIEQQSSLFFKSKEVRLGIPPEKAEVLKKGGYVNKSITLGVRPEDIREDVVNVEGAEHNSMVHLKVEVIENMGSELFLHLLLNNETIIARVPGQSNPTIGHSTKLKINMNKVHFFDSVSEYAIR
ncbi:ABC transporter ATP-binding protein [Robertmurraya beringensis]|uniref:ABC transporter ATP-binding protein n=1 Tax=Robertmurraya beringensis TaxID=641660 RepID=A0ABV6KR16_9BACI